MRLKSNLSKLYWSYFLTGMVLFYGIEKLFFLEIGVDAVGIGIVSTSFLLTALIFDIPSGVLADKWSRKNVLIVSALMMLLSLAVLGVSQNLTHYVIGALIYGVYYILLSGTYEALTYDSLHELDRTNEFSKVLGRQNGLAMLGVVAGTTIGGLLGDVFSLRSTYFFSFIPALANLWVLTTLSEPQFHKKIANSKLTEHMKKSVQLLISRSTMRILSALFIVLIVVGEHTDEFGMVYLIALGFGPIGTGILSGVLAGSEAVGQFFAHRFAPFYKWLMPFAAVNFALFAFLESHLGLFFYGLALVAASATWILTETVIQDEISSDVRATVISVLGFAGNLIAIPAVLTFGYITRETDVFNAFQYLAIGVIIFTVIFHFNHRRSHP